MIRKFLCVTAILLSGSSLAGVIESHPPVPTKPEHYQTMADLALAAGAFAPRSPIRVPWSRRSAPRDLLVVRRVQIDELSVGDVIVFQRWYDLRPELVVHRVKWTDGRSVITEGDHVRKADPEKTSAANLKGASSSW